MKKLLLVFVLITLGVSLEGQVNLQNIIFYGKVHEGGRGVGNVAVTDGINVCYTNAKGEYSLLSNTTADFVYISTPSGYEIPLNDNRPEFFVPITDKKTKKQKIDFILKTSSSDNKHAFIVWADPQIYLEKELMKVQQAADDVKELVEKEYKNIPVHGFVCGDIVSDRPQYYDTMKKMIASTAVPFMYVIGNHDLTLEVRSDDLSKETFRKNFGPDYYSFNRGKVHYVVLDDVFYVARAYYYIGYLPEKQLNWLEQDLAKVPEGSTVVVTFHIPTYNRDARDGNYTKETMSNSLQNRQALYSLLKPFNAHLISGHMHRNENYIIKENLFEHVQGALCGLFWQTPMNTDGTPLGYSVYEVEGNTIKWYSKSLGKDKTYQFRGYSPGECTVKPTALVANVWNYDDAWKVYWYENGVRKGEMEKFITYDPDTYNFVVKNSGNFIHKWISASDNEHMFFAEPNNKDAKFKIEVIDRFGNIYSQEL